MFVITHIDGLFPGANTLDAWWQQLLHARVAPTQSLASRWQIPREKYYCDYRDQRQRSQQRHRTYMDRAHCLDDESLSSLVGSSLMPEADIALDRQVRLARYLLRRLLTSQNDPDINDPDALEETGLVLGTSWTAESYFQHDLKRCFSRPEFNRIHLPDFHGEACNPQQQVERIAEALCVSTASSQGAGKRLGGPCLAVDTACASSMNALDSAMRLIESGQAERMVVMGLNLSTPIFLFTGFSNLGALSPKGELKAFASDSSGIVIGEMVGAMVIERYESAVQRGAPILAQIRGLGLSADGGERSVFAPGPRGQRLAYERAYQQIDLNYLDYLEAHGTGTPLGDETELKSLNRFFSARLEKECDEPRIPIGAVKSMLGHTLAAAGMASLLKAVLMLQHRCLVPHIPVTPSKELGVFELLTEPRYVESKHRPMRVGVSSHGFGGANAHVVLESADVLEPLESLVSHASYSGSGEDDPVVLIDISLDKAKGGSALLDEVFKLDTRGLRMGPKPLERVDAFQLLLIQHLQAIRARQGLQCYESKTAVVVATNLGGDLTQQLSRRDAWLFWHDDAVSAERVSAIADQLGPNYSTEAMASCMPSMCSGYPAYHFDFMGFHQTVSGGSDVFWQMLAAAKQWLSKGIEFLYLGAGRFLGSDLTMLSAEVRRGHDIVAQEAAGFCLLTKQSTALSLGLKPIARFSKALRANNLDDVYRQLSADAREEGRDDNRQDDIHERCSTDASMGIASGLVTLDTVVQRLRERAIIENDVSDHKLFEDGLNDKNLGEKNLGEKNLGEKNLGEKNIVDTREKQYIVMQRLGSIDSKRESPKKHMRALEKRGHALDMEVCLRQTQKPNTLPAHVNSIDAKTDVAIGALSAKGSFKGSDKENAKESAQKNSDPSSVSAFRHWLNATEKATQRFYLQQGFLARYKQRARSSALSQSNIQADLYKNPQENRKTCSDISVCENTVLQQINSGVRALTAEYRDYDEMKGHPYFYDHPLDHIPGVLLVEGIQQLAEAQPEPVWIKRLTLRFRQYCELTLPTKLCLEPFLALKSDELVNEYRGHIVQEKTQIERCQSRPQIQNCVDIECCWRSFNSRRQTPVSQLNASSPAENDVNTETRKDVLHKVRKENIVISPLEFTQDETQTAVRSRALCPKRHFLEQSGGEVYSPTFFFEVLRQFMMLVAHEVLGEPSVSAMVWLSVDLDLERPVRKTEAVQISLTLGTHQVAEVDAKLQSVKIDSRRCQLWVDEEFVGTVGVKAQMSSPDFYEQQRWSDSQTSDSQTSDSQQC